MRKTKIFKIREFKKVNLDVWKKIFCAGFLKTFHFYKNERERNTASKDSENVKNSNNNNHNDSCDSDDNNNEDEEDVFVKCYGMFLSKQADDMVKITVKSEQSEHKNKKLQDL